MVRPKRLGHVVLRVRDVERSEQFYTDVLIPVIQSTPTLPLGLPA